MKRFLLVFAALALSFSSFSQVFNTGQTLKPKVFSVGVEPAMLINGSSEFMLFLHGGYGIRRGIDFGVKVGVLGPENYFGGRFGVCLSQKHFACCGGA